MYLTYLNLIFNLNKMSCNKKPSGAEYRKRRKLNEIECKKQAIEASKFFIVDPGFSNSNVRPAPSI